MVFIVGFVKLKFTPVILLFVVSICKLAELLNIEYEFLEYDQFNLTSKSIQVLKGANASALYGSRASNGVIIITTKKAKNTKGKIKVNIDSNFSVISNREYPYYQYVYGAGDNARLTPNVGKLDQTTGLPLVGAFRRAYGMPFLGQQILDYNGL